MIENEVGYGVLPLEFARPYLASKKIIAINDGKTFPYSLSLAWHPRNQHPHYFSAVIKACR